MDTVRKAWRNKETKHWPFPFIPQLPASPAFFGDSLRAESGALKRRGQECGKWGKQHRLIPGDSGLTPWDWEPSPYLCGLPTKNAINYSQCENKWFMQWFKYDEKQRECCEKSLLSPAPTFFLRGISVFYFCILFLKNIIYTCENLYTRYTHINVCLDVCAYAYIYIFLFAFPPHKLWHIVHTALCLAPPPPFNRIVIAISIDCAYQARRTVLRIWYLLIDGLNSFTPHCNPMT